MFYHKQLSNSIQEDFHELIIFSWNKFIFKGLQNSARDWQENM